MEEKEYTVYKHTTPNGKVYIGITTQPVEKRWGKNGCQYKKQPFYHAIEKYGWDNIKHEILYTHLTEKEAYNKEIELIQFYKSYKSKYGYNRSLGGEIPSSEAATKHKVAVKQYDTNGNFIKQYDSITEASKIYNNKSGIFDCCIGRNKTSAGFVWRYASDEFDKYDCVHKSLGKPVCQYDRDDNFIAEYINSVEAEKITGIPHGMINSVANGNRKTTGGYKWKYVDNNKYLCSDMSRLTKVNQYDIYGNFIREYDSSAEASRILQIESSNINTCCKGKVYTAGGYVWRFNNDSFDKYEIKCVPNIMKPVSQYSKEGVFIQQFDTMKKASEETKTNLRSISNCCKGDCYTAGGFIWRYIDDDFNKYDIEPTRKGVSICQYSLNGELINTYDSIAIAIKKYGNGVPRNLMGLSKTAYGYIWKRQGEPFEPPNIKGIYN